LTVDFGIPFKFTGEKVSEIEVIADPARLRQLELVFLDD